jgi:subtilisin family serine protease
MDLETALPGQTPFLDRLAAHPDTLLVAAAGNNGADRPFGPACSSHDLDNVIGVGALRESGTGRACFSGFGPWVTVYAPGERLSAGFFEAPLRYRHSTFDTCQFVPGNPDPCTCTTPSHVGELSAPGHGDVVHFEGRAQWSGTSFATPLVAGMIARRKAADGGGVRRAADDVLKEAVPVTVEGAPARAVFPANYTGPRPE